MPVQITNRCFSPRHLFTHNHCGWHLWLHLCSVFISTYHQGSPLHTSTMPIFPSYNSRISFSSISANTENRSSLFQICCFSLVISRSVFSDWFTYIVEAGTQWTDQQTKQRQRESRREQPKREWEPKLQRFFWLQFVLISVWCDSGQHFNGFVLLWFFVPIPVWIILLFFIRSLIFNYFISLQYIFYLAGSRNCFFVACENIRRCRWFSRIYEAFRWTESSSTQNNYSHVCWRSFYYVLIWLVRYTS